MEILFRQGRVVLSCFVLKWVSTSQIFTHLVIRVIGHKTFRSTSLIGSLFLTVTCGAPCPPSVEDSQTRGRGLYWRLPGNIQKSRGQGVGPGGRPQQSTPKVGWRGFGRVVKTFKLIIIYPSIFWFLIYQYYIHLFFGNRFISIYPSILCFYVNFLVFCLSFFLWF